MLSLNLLSESLFMITWRVASFRIQLRGSILLDVACSSFVISASSSIFFWCASCGDPGRSLCEYREALGEGNRLGLSLGYRGSRNCVRIGSSDPQATKATLHASFAIHHLGLS